MKKNLTYIFITAVMLLGIISGCRKDNFEGTETGENGITHVRFVNNTDDAPLNILYFTPFTDVKKVLLWDLRRDVHSKASLNTAVTVTLEADQSAIDDYNTENGTDYELLPESIYTLDAPGYTKTATGYTVTFNPGEFARPFNINLNGSLYDLDKKYAVAFKVTTVTGDAKLTNVVEEKTIMVTIGIKNKYDGIYEITEGTLVDNIAPGLHHINDFLVAGGDDPMQYELRTISATQCLAYDNYFFGGIYYPIASDATYSRFGDVALIFEFDPATDKIVSITNYFGQEAGTNKRGFFLDSSEEYKWDSGTMDIKYYMTQKAGITPPLSDPYVKTTITETWKRIGDR